MNKFLKFGSVMSIALAATTFTSCEEGEPVDTVTEQSFLQCYAVTTDMQTLTQNVSQPVTIKLTLNYTKATATANISGFKNYSTITIEDVPWKIDEGWGEIDSDIVKAKTATGAPITISDFEIKWLDRLDFAETVGEYDPALEYSFIIDGRYKVTGSRAPLWMTGNTVSTPADGQAYTHDKAIYVTALNYTDQTASIGIVGVSFAQGMPAMNMTFPNIPFTFDADGKISMAAANIIPLLNGAPYNDFPISDFRAEIEPGDDMEITFMCNFRGTIYTVKCDLDFTSYATVI